MAADGQVWYMLWQMGIVTEGWIFKQAYIVNLLSFLLSFQPLKSYVWWLELVRKRRKWTPGKEWTCCSLNVRFFFFFFLRIKKVVYLRGNVDILRWFLCFFREVLLPHLRNFLYSKITLYQVRLSEITAMDKNNNYVGKITNITCYFPFVSFMIRLFLSAVGVTGSIMISRHVLLTILYTFAKVLTRGICLTVKRPFSW